MYIYGKNVAQEALSEPSKIRRIFLDQKFNDNDLLKKIKNSNVKFEFVNKKMLDQKVNGLHQGIILEINDYKYADLNDILVKENPLIVILDHLEDPHNFGAIIRTCECAGIKNIIIPKDRSVTVNDTVVKVSVGAIEHVKIIMVSNLVNAINKLKDMGYFIYTADMDGKNYKKESYPNKKVLVIGSEGNGVSRLVKEESDIVLSIPMKGNINSLNASASAAILIYGMIDND